MGRTALYLEAVALRPLEIADLVGLQFLHGEASSAEPPAGAQWVAHLSAMEPKAAGAWAVTLGSDPRAIGLIVYHAIDTAKASAILSYGLELDCRGRGIGSAAVSLAIGRMTDDVGIKTVFADVELINVASRRLLKKVGFVPVSPGNTPGVQVAPDRPAQRWRYGAPSLVSGRSILNMSAVGAL